MFSFCLFLLLTSLSLLALSFSLHKRLTKYRKTETHEPSRTDPPPRETERPAETDPPRLSRSLLLEVLPSDSSKWERLFEKEGEPDSSSGSGLGDADRDDPGGQVGKRKKRRGKKKGSPDPKGEEERERAAKTSHDDGGGEEDDGLSKKREDFSHLYPFTSSSSGTQRKIKQQYDEIMKHHRSKELTFAQVAQFAHCLVEAKTKLQHKADTIQRKFTIKKALLVKADRSSFDRLRQQIYKLELEQKRLEEDAFVYNWLQQQLKLSPAYKKMLEIGAGMELKAKSGELSESSDTEYSDISFEELLAQEKKDSFWQRNGKLRPCLS